MNMGLDCPCLINEGEEGGRGGLWDRLAHFASVLCSKGGQGVGVKANLNQETIKC